MIDILDRLRSAAEMAGTNDVQLMVRPHGVQVEAKGYTKLIGWLDIEELRFNPITYAIQEAVNDPQH